MVCAVRSVLIGLPAVRYAPVVALVAYLLRIRWVTGQWTQLGRPAHGTGWNSIPHMACTDRVAGLYTPR